MPDNVDKLFEIMQAKGAASDRDKFRKVFLTPGNKGYKIRKDIYDGLRADGIIDSPTYEDFRRKLRLGGTPTVNKYRQQMFNSVDPNKSRASELTHRAVGQAVRATNNVRKPVVAKVVNQKGKPTGEEFAITPAKTVEDLDREYAQETTKNWENELNDQMADADKDAAKISDMFKSFIGSTDEVGSVWGNMTRGGGIAGTPHSVTTNNGILENTEARQLLAAGDYNRKRRELLQLEQDSRNKAIFDNHSFFRGMYDAAKDTGFLTGGASDLINAGSLLATKQDLDNGIHTEAGDMLMQQAVKNSDAQSQYGDNQGWMYTGGVITTNMAPFMVQIGSAGFSKGMSNAIGKVVQGAASKVALGTMEKATGMAGAHIANYIGKVTGLTTKAFGKAIQYGIVGAAQANTVGLGNVANDVINRYTGQVYQDEHGNYKFGTFDSDGKLVHEGGEDFLTSLVKGEAAQTIEFATELAGGGIDAAGTVLKNFVTKGGKKIINKYNMENVSKVIDFLLNNKVSKNARYLKAGADRTLGKVELNSIVGESLEEELGIIANTVFTGDNKISDLWDEKQQSQIWGGMLLSIGLMKGIVAPFHAYNARQYYSYKHKLDKADVNLSQLLGKEKWEELRNQIDATTNDDMPEMVNKINRDVALGKNRQPVREYIQNLLIMRGYDIGNMLAAKKAVEDKGKGVSVKNMEKNQAYQQGRDAYGYDTHEIQLDQADKQKTLAQLLGITEQQLSTMSDEELDNLSGRDDNLDKAIYDYQLSTIRYQGVADNAQDQVDLAAQKAAQAVDMYTDKSRNTIRNATIKATGGLEDYGVYIINGNIATHDDGSIDVGNSDDMILFYDPTTNTVEHADATRFAELGSEENADEVRNQAVADAKENAIKEITGIIDGVVEVGTQFKAIDADGTEHTYDVLSDNGDGTAMITIDGNIPTQLVKGENVNVPVSFEELQKMKDASDQQRLQAAKAQREQMENERAEQQMQAQTTQAENPAQENNIQSAPIEDNLDYSDIIREDGKVQMVDVSDKDGNNLFPDAKDVFYIQGNKMRTKFAYIDANGELKAQSFPTGLVKIKTRGEVSVDDYKKYRSMILSAESPAMPESSMIEDNSGTIEANRSGIEVEDNTQPLSEADADNVIAQMESSADTAPDLELTPDNWTAEFGEDGTLSTPIGDVKMGENQVAKLFEKGRSKEFGMIKPTLTDPDVIIEVPSHSADGNEERSSSYLFIKTFLGKNGEKVYYFKSVTIKKDGLEISISSHYDRAKRVKEALMKGKLLYRKNDGAQTEQNQPSASVTTSQEDAAGSSESKDTNISSNGNENNESLTFEDGTPIPVDVNGEVDLSQTDAAHAAEWYDTNLGEDADGWLDGEINKAKKVLEQAKNRKLTGTKPSELVASKKEKEAAIADAQARYDSAISIRDSLKERRIAKEENTPEGRKNLIEKARRKFYRLKSAVKDDAEAVSQLYKDVVGSLLHRLYDGTGIDVTDTIPLTAEEYVASNLGAHSLNYEGTETSKGVKQETGLSREDFAKTQLLAADGKGTTIDDLVHSLWENRPSNLESLDTQDIRNALIGVLTSGFKASEARNYIENLRIAQAENILEEQKKAADNAVFAEEQKAPAEEQTETTPESEEKTEENNSDEINDEENEQTNAPEQNKFPDKLKEGSKTIEVPDDATEENPLGLQLSEDKVPFEIEGGKSGETYNINDNEDRQRLINDNKVDDKDILDIDMPKHVHKAIKELCKKMGLKVQFLYMGARSNGWIENGTMYLALDTKKATQFVFGHEMTHAIKQKNPEAYKELVKVAMAVTTRKKFEEDLAKVYQNYHGISGYNNVDDFVEEVVADNLGKFINDFDLAQKFSLRLNHPVLATILHAIQEIKHLLYGDFYKPVDALERIVEQAYVKTANGQVTNTETGEDVSFSLRQKPEPKKKGIGYKVFVLKDGKLYPPMVANPDGAATPVGVWLDADATPIAGESKTGRPQVKQGGKGTQGGSGKLAYRPGWHLGVVPYAIQFNRKDADGNKTLFPKNFVFAEVEYAADVDYQEEARQEGINPSGKYQHSLAGLKHLPTDSYYMYRTNPNPETDPWVITGAMKVNRILTRAEQAEIVKNAGREPQQIQEGDIVTDDVVNSINQEIADTPKFSLKVYHGSGADFTEFDFDHMGEGAGSQAFGWGGYVTSSKKIGKSYATLMDNDPSKAYYRIQRSNGTRFAKKYPTLESFLYGDKQIAMNDKFTEQEKIDFYNEMKKLAEPYHNFYEVDIPDDNGSNYLDWDAPITDELIDKVAKALPSLRSYDIKDLKKDRTFDNFYKTISMRSVTDDASFNDDKAASKLFSSLGYTGIKYKAGRNFGGAEEGDTNYVIFKPEDMKITEHTKFSLKSKPVRFEAGKKLSDEEKKEVLSTLKDAYKVNGVPYHIEETAGGKEKRVYEPTADSYVVSDITNRPLRYYITLPDGRVAHPTEVYPNISDNEVKSSATKQGLLDDEADQIVSAAIGNMKDIADNAKAVEVLTELQNLPHETHDVGYGLNNAKSYNYKTGIFTSDAAQAIDYVVRRMRRKEDVPAEIPAALKMAVADSYGMVDNLIDGMSNTKVGAAEIKPVGVGAFGNIYNQFRGKAKAAIEFLKKLGSGEAAAALQHHTIGDISLVWGDKKTGLDKILRKHPEVVDNLQSIIDSMEVVQESDNRIKLESPTHFAVVSKEYKGEPREQWLLTAYEKRESLENGKSMDTATSSLGGDTALSQSKESAAKIGNSSEIAKENEEKFSLKDEKTMFGMHNISIDKLRKAIKQGGFAAPSMGVVDSKNGIYSDYGEITLIPKAEKLAKRTGKNAGTFTADAWTPTYPQVERIMNKQGEKAFNTDMNEKLGDVDNGIYSNIRESWKGYLSSGDVRAGLYWHYLFDKGMNPETIYQTGKYENDITNEVMRISDNGNKTDYTDKEVAELIRLMNNATGKDNDVEAQREKLKARIASAEKQGNHLLVALKKKRLAELEGVENFYIAADFVKDVVRNNRKNGKVDVHDTMSVAKEKVENDKKLSADFPSWLDKKTEEYGVEEMLYNGTTPSGKPKYIPNTIDNAVKLMKKQGVAGGYTAFGSELGVFIAKNSPEVNTLAAMKKAKDKLIPFGDERHNQIKDKITKEFLELSDEIRVGSNNRYAFDDSGVSRMVELTDHKGNEKEYLKKAYNIEVSDEWMDRYNKLLDTIKKDYKVFYFETKFMRPYGLDEFEKAIVPSDTPSDVVDALKKAGIDVSSYERGNAEDRQKVTMEAINSSDNIRFSLKAEKEKIVADAKENGTYMTAPNGEKTKLDAEQWATVRTTNFKNWFGDWENDPENASKVVDENGEPLVVYHGTTNDETKSVWNEKTKSYDTSHEPFTVFKREVDGLPNSGLFFNSSEDNAYEYGYNNYAVYLSAKNPLVIDCKGSLYNSIKHNGKTMDTYDWANWAEENGYDGVIFKNIKDGVDYGSMQDTTDDYVVFKSNQIKSAENNNGDFSADNNDIRFSLKSMMAKPEGWKQANKKAIHIAEAIERDPKFSLKNLDGTLIKAGTYFSGGGLVEEGLKGIIDPVVAVEYDEKISGVYRNNFGQHIVTADVRDVDPKELVKQIDGEVEYFHASPVCKNYSQAKSNHAEVELDKETAASTAEFINAVKPKVVTIENVKGYKDSDAMKIITDALDANGYTWDADVYNAADFGGYTNRERLIVRAVRDGQLPEKPKKMARKSGWYEAVADIIPTLTEKKNGVAPWMDVRLKADGIDWRNIDKPLYVMGSAYADGKIPHAFADELLPTLRTKSGDVIVMPDGKVYRAMGRVLARVSGVSDDYKMPFSENLSHTIIGNGIPTQLTEHVIAPLLQNTLRPTTPDDGNTKFSLRGSTPYDKQMEEWMEKNHLEKGAVPMEKPIMKEGENIFDYANRMVEWTRNQNLWKTAPKQTGFQDALAKWKADNGLSPDAYPPVRPHRENYSTEIGYTEDLEEYNKKKEIWKSAPKPKDFDLSVDLEDMNKQLRNIRRAVLNQKNYDQRTVKAVSDLVRKMLNIGWGDGLSRGRVGNLLSAAKNATGANDVKKYLDKAMGILAENYLNRLSTAYDNLINTRGARADQSGVIKMGSLDAKGQAFMSEYKKAINMDDKSLNNYIANIEEDSAKNEDNVEMNDYRLAGIQAAIMYKQQIGGNDADISELKRQIGELKNKKDATKEDKDLLKSLEKKLFENKFDRITMYENLLNNIQRMVKESKGRAKEFREDITEHKNEILHRANLDLEGVDSTYYDTATAKKKFVNNDLQRAVFSSTYTFEQFLKFFGKHSANGEGRLYNYFHKLNQDALDEEQLYNEMNRNALDEKTKELFGKDKFMKLVGIDGKGMKEMDVEVTDYSNKETGKRTIHLKQGQMLYIYLVNKETDGEMKLRAMGITEEDVAAIEENLDPRVKAMGEWLQDEYLPECQRRYQVTHTKYFGAPMKEVENYFPLAINNRARNVKEDVNQDSDAMSQLAGTSTGAIVTRRVNVIPLDIENADAFEVAFNHLQEMEEWSAMLPFRQDINTLLSYTHFRNQVQNMSSVAYGSGKTLWDEFKQTAQIAAGTYKPKVNAGMMDSRIAAAMGGIAVAKISGRLWTAIKQSQSATVFLPECDFTRFVKNGVNPYGSWKWAKKNIPDFRKRVENMTYGDVKLRQYLDELEKWHDWTKTISKIGMAPNILVDGITCAVGARSVYETEVNRLTKLGYPKEKAEEKAYYKAVAAYNKTQQSSGGMYLSPMQVDRTYASAALSLFKNANYAYGRMQIEACRGLARTYDLWGGKHKTTLIESMTRQIMEEDGLDENTARAIAKATYNRTFRQSIGRLINFATLVPVSWALYKVLPYLLTGDDDDKKNDMIEEAVLKGFATSLSDNYVIPFASNILNAGLKVEDGKPTFDPEVFRYQNLYINPATSDLANIYSMIGNQKWYSVANKLGMLGVQSLIGFNPETVGALYQAFAEADYDNGNTAKEWQIGILKAISAPEESIRELYMDELGLKSGDKDAMKKFMSLAGLDADDINKVPLAELEKRYAERQINRDNLLSQVFMDAETFNGYVEKYQKSFEKKIKDKMDKWDEYDKKKADEFFDTTSDPKLKDMIAKKRANDANAAADEQIAKEGLNQEKKGKEPSEEAYDAVKMSIDVAEDNAISTYNKVLNKRYAALNDEYNEQTDAMKYIFMSKHPNFKAYKDLESEYTTYGKKLKELKEKLVSADGYDAKQTILKQIRAERDKFYELQSKVR